MTSESAPGIDVHVTPARRYGKATVSWVSY